MFTITPHRTHRSHCEYKNIFALFNITAGDFFNREGSVTCKYNQGIHSNTLNVKVQIELKSPLLPLRFKYYLFLLKIAV